MIKATLRIFTYKGKASKKYYKMAYFARKYFFVHISKEKLTECLQKKTKDGRKYLEYNGVFSLNREKGEITI